MDAATVIAPVLEWLRLAVLAAALLATAAAFAAHAVQTRRITPRGQLARTIHRLTDPLLIPIERRLMRARMNPQHAPWWLAGATVFGGILVLTLVEWVAIQVLTAREALAHGSRGFGVLVLDWGFGLLGLALIVRVLGSWVGATRYTSWMKPFVLATEWFLAPLRRVIPNFGMFDITPLVAWFLLQIVRTLVLSAL
jgi:YggT family protein